MSRFLVLCCWLFAGLTGFSCWWAIQQNKTSIPEFSSGILPKNTKPQEISRIEIVSPQQNSTPCILKKEKNGTWVLPKLDGIEALNRPIEDMLEIFYSSKISQQLPTPEKHLARLGLDPKNWKTWLQASKHSSAPRPLPLQISLYKTNDASDEPTVLLLGNPPSVPENMWGSSSESRFIISPVYPGKILTLSNPINRIPSTSINWANPSLPHLKSFSSIQFQAHQNPLVPSFSSSRKFDYEPFSNLPAKISPDQFSKFEAAWASPRFLDIKPLPDSFSPDFTLILESFSGFAWKAEFLANAENPSTFWMKLSPYGNIPNARPILDNEILLADKFLFRKQFSSYRSQIPAFLHLTKNRLFLVSRTMVPVF